MCRHPESGAAASMGAELQLKRISKSVEI